MIFRVADVPGHGNGGRPTPNEKGDPAAVGENMGGGGGGARNCWNADSGQNEGPAPTPRPIPSPMPKPAVGGEGASGSAAPETPADRPGSESAFRSIANACSEHEEVRDQEQESDTGFVDMARRRRRVIEADN